MHEATCGIFFNSHTEPQVQQIIVPHMLGFRVPCTGKGIKLVRLDEADVKCVCHSPPGEAREDAALEFGPVFLPRKTPLKLLEEPGTSALPDRHCGSTTGSRQQPQYLLRNHRAALKAKISNIRKKAYVHV